MNKGSDAKDYQVNLVPVFGNLVNTVKSCLVDGGELECALNDLHSCRCVLTALVMGFNSKLRSCDFTAEQEHVVQAIATAFSLVGAILASLEQMLKERNVEGVWRDIDNALLQLRFLERAMGDLEKLEKARPKYSDVPGVDAMLKAGYAVVEGRRPWSVLIARLENVRPITERMSARQDLPDVWQAHLTDMRTLFKICDEKDLEKLPSALEMAKVSGEKLVHSQREQASAVSEVKDACLPAYAQQLISSADLLRGGVPAWKEFSAAVEELHKRVQQTSLVYDTLPDDFLCSNVQGQCVLEPAPQTIKELMKGSLEHFRKALALFESLNPDDLPDVSVLDGGLREVMSGIEQVRSVSARMRLQLGDLPQKTETM